MFLAKWRQPKLCLLCLAAIFFSLLQIVLTNELVQIYPTTNNELISNIGGYSDNWQSPQFSEFSSGKDEKGLFPSIFNLATHAEIRASSTCGQHGPDYYCKLVEHVFLRQPQCDICDANNHHKNHPIDYAIDGTKRWWQSPTLSNGLNYERIYQVAYVIVKSAISPRPGSWVLEKSLDGINFYPWQYFAASDPDCMRLFGMPASTGVPKFETDDQVICTSYFSKLNPLEHGEIHISLVNGRPGVEKSSQLLHDFTKTRFVRLRLLGLKTLHADLMVINHRDKTLDHSVTRRYFYTISDISIGGQCICYGHAERCTPDVVHGQFRCECRHNTCGESCSQCCPLFNQLPWQVGTHEHPNICQSCQCFNHATKCVYDAEVERQRLSVTPEGIYEGGGKCLDCQHNTEGINCEKCKKEYFRPANISHYRHDACRPCNCDLTGSENNVCIRDETEAFNDMRPGDCRCKPGFGGRRCERCALGFRRYPLCEPCKCHQSGSLNFETCEEEHCICKQNVEGERCDRCRPGTIYLDNENPLGCQPCFCFGKSSECRENFWNVGQISHNNGWNLTDLLGLSSIPQPQTFINNGIIDQQLIFNIEDLKSLKRPLPQFYYWSAPKNFLGNRLNSFGSNLHYFVYYVPREFDRGQQTPVADIVIEGNGVKLEYYSRINFFPRENISVTIPLKPTQNWLDGRTRRPIDKAMMMRVLADLSTFLVRARYHQDQLQSSIYGFRMETAYEQHNLQINSNIFPISLGESTRKHVLPVEVCTCPEHFDGNSCERCQLGYRRVNNQLFDGICKKCECQGHSQECDPFNGKCLNCQHNTTGSRCEQCLPGFYGNPSLGGVLGQCRPCACPTVENPRSKQCALSQLVLEGAAAVGQDEYVCTACEAGYDGNKCEICADGYFGDPFASDPQKACRPCECNGNIDNAAIGNCDRTTGECLRCIGHTTGSKCEECLSNHWGSALAHTCRPCRCHSFGSLFPQCSNQTGQCQCREGYTSDRCDRCLPGHGDVGNGCPECQCNITGSLGTVCDEVSGQCVCKRGIYGKRCDLCVPSYYNFGPEGCQFCHCNELGAVAGKECHNITGECQCLPNVVGSKCESCAPGFFNMTAGIGCEPCNCAQMSSEGTICDERTGQCRCKSGVTGLKCDKCEPNYYGIGPTGCKRCRVCPSVGQVCDSVTGACVCPPNTQGEMCERCTSNAWNYHQYRGCQLCQCDGIGADSQICDQRTGQCKCKPGYVGHRCDLCEPGHHSFPECKSCQCSLSGTEPSECRGNTCLCSSKEGQCKCKKHVFGLKCDNCIEGAFSLEAWHPLGCTKCFCFERSTECRQAERLYWRQQYAPDRKVVFESPFEMFERKHNLHVLREWPNDYNSHPTNHTPLYWPMPESFKNDRTGSYNGFLRFRIRNEDHNYKGSFLQPNVHIFRLFPQVVLIGSTRIELEHVPPHSTNIDDGIYKVRLHESQWRNRISPQIPVTRKEMMIALLNVQHIFIRATYNDMYRGDSISISEISLDVAEELEGGIFDKKEPALGVEQCFNCASGYTGRSCQEAAHGFFIAYITDYLNRPDPIVLSGIARPCDCHSHSQLCDPKTGECIDCLHNTVGTHCERCKDGYYGDALSGLPDACHRCLCPLEDNSLTSTCIASDSSGRGYYCIDCNPGHVGMFCEFCEAGYYGNPLQPGGRCTPCGCHPHGSLSSVCHNITGQCQCREGVEGRACSICSPRHAFLNGVCASCDQGCYRELMLIEDDMEKQLLPLRELISKARPIPHKRLARIRTSVTILSSLLDSIGGEGLNSLMAKPDLSWSIPLTEGRGLEGIDDPTSRSFRHAHILAEEFRLLQERNNESLIKLGNLENNLIKIRAKVQAENKRAIDIVNQLSQFVHRSGQSTSSSQLQYWLDRANSILNTSRERMAIIEKKYNYAKKNAEEAERLLNEITARKLNTTSYGHLVEKHREYQILIKDFRNTLWDEARTGSLAAKNTSLMAESELINLQKIIEEIEKYIKLIEEEINNGNQNIKLIEEKTVENEETGKEIKEKLILKIKNLREEELQNLEGDYLIINELKETKMPLAEKHALELEKQALKLKGQFADTQIFSMDALAASNVYELIINSLQNATMFTASARHTVDTAFSLIDPKEDNSLFYLSNKSAIKSIELNNKVDETLKSLGVKEQSNRLWNVLDNLGNEVLTAQKNISWMRDVQQLLEDHHDRISTVFTSVDDAHEGLDSIKETIIEFNEDVEGIKKRVDSLQQFTSSSIKESIKNLTESAKEVDLLEKDFGLLEERTEEHSKQIKLLRKDLGVLKEKIDEAREKAAKIRIGVRSDPGSGCIREFLSPMRPTASNTISLKYRPVMDSPDSLLLFTQVQGTRTQNREYLAIELKQKKIHVKWDIGDGRREAAIIKRNIVYIPASARYTWYHIEVKRVANTVQVSVVQRLSVGGDSSRDIDEPTQVVVGKPDVNSDVIFNVIPGQTRLSLGLKDKSLAEELGFSTNKFLGTVGEMNVDGVNVPLWVFSKTEGMCEGATGPPVKTAIGHFFRNGFAQIRFPMAERSSSMLAVQFSAYSPNGLLYFRGSPTSGEFIGLELHEGAVALKADFGPEAKIALQLNGTNYADGRAHKVRVIRRDGEVHLQADPEADHISIALADSKALLDITESDHFVGGVPPDFPTAHFLQDHDLNFEGFFGCIHSVRPNQLSELDFDNPLRAQRKEAGCRYQEERLSTSERIIGFQGIDGGFLKTRGILLDSDATFSFNFRTKSLNALLLYQSADLQRLEQQRRAKRRRRTMKEEELEEIILRERRDVLTNPNDQSFLAFYLIDGRLTIHLGTDSDERIKRPVISSTQTYSDGLLHSVFLSRMGKEIQVRINDREVLATILDDERSIGGDRWTMLLGGVPSRLESLIQEAEVGTIESLVGCLSDFQLDYDRLPIILEEHHGTILGSCSLENGINEIIYENSENKNPAKDAPLINIEEEEDKYPLQQQQLFRKKSKQSLEQLAPTTVGGLLNNDNKNSEDTSEEEPIQSQCEGINKINFGDLKEYRFGLSESSHSKINFVEKPYPNYTNFSISFEFRTEQRKGLLWVWASYRNYSRYFILHMDRGILKLVIKGHHQIKKLNYREKRFDDGKWHKLEIIKRGREISLKVDEFTTEKLLDAPSPKVMRRRMYIGGVISKHRRMFHLPRNRLPPSFNGCVRHFIVNGHEWDLNLNSKDVIHCAHTPGIGYIHNNGFAAFSPLDTQKTHLTTVTHKKSKEAKTIDLSIKFRLLPENLKENSKTKGRLLFAFLASGDDWQLKPRFVLWIDNNGMLGLSLHSSPHNIHIDTLFDSLNNSKNSFIVCPGQWHHFKLFLSTKGIKIELNEKIIKFGEQRLPLSLITQLRSLPVFVGGINASKALSLGIRSLFGCIQQFEIEGEQIIFEAKNANKWHKIIANGCPFN